MGALHFVLGERVPAVRDEQIEPALFAFSQEEASALAEAEGVVLAAGAGPARRALVDAPVADRQDIFGRDALRLPLARIVVALSGVLRVRGERFMRNSLRGCGAQSKGVDYY